MKKNTLSAVRYKEGEAVLCEPVTCSPYGEMSDGTMVWADSEWNQYTKCKVRGKYYFFEI